MARKCTKCGKVGHNSRTCSKERGIEGGKIKLFGVQIDASSNIKLPPQSPSPSLATILHMKKSLSAGSLQSSSSSCSCSLPSTPSSSSNSHVSSLDEHLDKLIPGYASDHGRDQPKKKGVPWAEEEHRRFLRGLEKLGKGDWRGISREFVRTRTPTQVASHAQKYFIRQLHLQKFHKFAQSSTRPSVFDTAKSHNLGFEKGKESKCKQSDHSFQLPKTSKISQESLLTNFLTRDKKQTFPSRSGERLNLELTLESGKGIKDLSRVPSSSCMISFTP